MAASVSTHVLDTGTGRPADGVRIELWHGDVQVVVVATDSDGRARLADGLEPGLYRVVFHPPSAFFRQVSLEVALPDGHTHVPLLVSPYGCASYRGS